VPAHRECLVVESQGEALGQHHALVRERVSDQPPQTVERDLTRYDEVDLLALEYECDLDHADARFLFAQALPSHAPTTSTTGTATSTARTETVEDPARDSRDATCASDA